MAEDQDEFLISVKVEVTRFGDNGEHTVLDASKNYEVKSLENLPAIVTHFGGAVALMIEGEKLGAEA